ncbi:hypothetical protein GCM10025868_16670 [Angustibacter aerolatus]|uniref:DUF3263 domain-containing protein n=1 Tax=Angustibacter aerolatus TaxID=1162965 RepID=A0ABQ6JHS5_9ACTN|nr:hypothetical protein GCM10025868_16670 [Angustibacter aerolatus]
MQPVAFAHLRPTAVRHLTERPADRAYVFRKRLTALGLPGAVPPSRRDRLRRRLDPLTARLRRTT